MNLKIQISPETHEHVETEHKTGNIAINLVQNNNT